MLKKSKKPETETKVTQHTGTIKWRMKDFVTKIYKETGKKTFAKLIFHTTHIAGTTLYLRGSFGQRCALRKDRMINSYRY